MPIWKGVGVGILFFAAIGVIAGVFAGGFPEMWKMGHVSGWSWWQYALALPVLGLLYMLLIFIGEVAGLALGRVLPPRAWIEKGQPLWKKAAFASFYLGIVAVVATSPLWLEKLG